MQAPPCGRYVRPPLQGALDSGRPLVFIFEFEGSIIQMIDNIRSKLAEYQKRLDELRGFL